MSLFETGRNILTRLFQLDISDEDTSASEEREFSENPEYLWAAEEQVPPDAQLEERRLLFFHSLTRALHRGCSTSGPSSRPGLPIELVCLILEYAGCMLLSKSRSITTSSTLVARGSSNHDAVVVAQLPPFDAVALQRIAQIKLITLSRDQGWVSDRNAGNWSWFDVAVLRGDSETEDGQERELREIDGEPAVWRSHENVLAGRDLVEHTEGIVFGPEHLLWRTVREGDVVVGRARARFGGWKNETARADFLVWEYFDPLSSAHFEEPAGITRTPRVLDSTAAVQGVIREEEEPYNSASDREDSRGMESSDLFQLDILTKDTAEEHAFDTNTNFICADRSCDCVGPAIPKASIAILSFTRIPLELVSLVLKHADCALLSKSCSTMAVQPFDCHEERLAGCEASVVVCLPPLDSLALQHIAHIKLVTLSRDQGWQNDPNSRNYSWFDVGVVQGSQPGRDLGKTNGQPALWMSGFSRHEGDIWI
ncbi:hypothetical protein EVG20_g5188 [Dentipellis fragilis]|uniref:Uncharacterized protein n=1 Tax=Dentipellis fragilis TaxID=205917 RepID=A0A4Y9YU25_9AGAM|nr:hypothetical protein EVG20_g5188 [Dentipellis fragilis]